MHRTLSFCNMLGASGSVQPRTGHTAYFNCVRVVVSLHVRTGRRSLFSPSSSQRRESRTQRIHFYAVRHPNRPQDRTDISVRRYQLKMDGHPRTFSLPTVCTYEMNKLNGVRLDLFLQKANLRMANVDLSATPPNVSIEGVQGFVPVEVTHAAACCCECPRGSVRDP
jgi:hypothetical protein